MNNNLIDTFDIKNKDIITIVGAGGKTSLMFSASSLFRKDYKVLVTTTTHIYVPDKNLYDEMIMLSDIKDDEVSRENQKYDNKSYNDENHNNEKYSDIIKNNKNGVYVIGNYIVNNSNSNTSNCNIDDSKVNFNKIKGLTFDQLDKITPYFDIVIIEGDGSKEKPLKGWNDKEPVVYHKTTKTIGVVDISSIGLYINEENIHRVEKFLKIIDKDSKIINQDLETNNKKSLKVVKLEHVKNLVLHENGLFKIYKGEKILFINKVENINDEINALNLIENIKNENPSYIDKFIYGSVFKDKFIEE
ncbi:selenium cofactor biosynthesis protein YqeC [Terrisporobacter sp.]|uniref:selenium cofactor biosynthesis protein YqeC n=1 Tax=Terrisporobacter sp. TaxID=1965305 RepID=UPI002630F392|nr:selenium cofactor biosynthesis protein YqeC [Terrisporobacter sp.]